MTIIANMIINDFPDREPPYNKNLVAPEVNRLIALRWMVVLVKVIPQV
jgi:hypothetical protein